VLALVDGRGGLAFAGTTTELDRAQRAEVAALVEDVEAGRPHPWADGRPHGDLAHWGRTTRAAVHLVRPTLVVEVSTDSSVDRGRWRHPVALVRVRPDLTPAETTQA
jgi:ATP-dependent DNA ligase